MTRSFGEEGRQQLEERDEDEDSRCESTRIGEPHGP
jgi:hypothetical protein